MAAKRAGRPQKNNVDFFPFFCQEGKKMQYIEKIYGNDGYATFVKMLREIAVTDFHYLNLNDPVDRMLLSAKCNVSEEKLINIIDDLAKIGNFDKDLWLENKIVWSPFFIDKIQEAYFKRNNDCINLDNLRVLLLDLGVLKSDLFTLEGVENTQIRLDKIREDIIIQDNNNSDDVVKPEEKQKIKPSRPVKKVEEKEKPIPSFQDFKEYALGQKSNLDLFSLEMKYKSWVSNDWKDGYDNKIKNWKSKLLNVIPHLKTTIESNVSSTQKGAGTGKMNKMTL